MNMETILTHSPALIIAVPLLGAFLTPLVSRVNKEVRNIFVIAIMGLTGFLIALLSHDVLINGNMHTYVFGSKTIGSPVVRILFQVDAMNGFMIIIGAILAFVAVIYSYSFMKEETGLDKFYTLMLLMTAGMLGMMLTGDMFNFFVFLEITSIASCALIAFWTKKGSSVQAAFRYIVVSTIGALFILFAIAILYGQHNALNMAVLAKSIDLSNASTAFLDKIALGLLVAGLGMKAGIVPMHLWLPDSYGRAPAPVSVILVGTTQAGLYALLRVIFTIYGNNLLYVLKHVDFEIINSRIIFDITINGILGGVICSLAVITMLIGVLMALKQTNLKKMIAFAAVAEIGYMILAFGAAILSMSKEVLIQTLPTGEQIEYSYTVISPEGQMALKGGIFHIINDALDVALLFLVAGAIYYATKQTSLNKMGGLARNMKYTTIFFAIGLFAVSGMPPMNGFASKLLIYQSTFLINPILGIIAILCSILLLATFVKVFHSAFLGPKLPQFQDVKEVPKSMLAAMLIISCVIILFGLFPELILNNLVEPAANALKDNSIYISTVIGGA